MTQYPLRVADRALSEADALEVLERAEYVVVSTVDEDGMPYGVPLSFVLVDGCLYVHTTNTFGHKLDDFAHNARICVTAVVDVEACYKDDFMTTRYASTMVFGHIRRVEKDVKVKKALVALCMKYLPEQRKQIGAVIEGDIDKTAVWVIEPEYITGKANQRLK